MGRTKGGQKVEEVVWVRHAPLVTLSVFEHSLILFMSPLTSFYLLPIVDMVNEL